MLLEIRIEDITCAASYAKKKAANISYDFRIKERFIKNWWEMEASANYERTKFKTTYRSSSYHTGNGAVLASLMYQVYCQWSCLDTSLSWPGSSDCQVQ